MAAESSILEAEVYFAELVEQSPTSSRRELNLSMLSTVAISIVFLLLAMSFGNAIVYDSNDDVSFSGVTAANTAEAIVIYHNDTQGGHSSSRLILYIDNANGLPTATGVGIDVNIQFSNELTKIFSL